MATMECKSCGRTIDKLEEFPGGVCVDCYANTPEGRRMPTADEVTAMWGGRPAKRTPRERYFGK